LQIIFLLDLSNELTARLLQLTEQLTEQKQMLTEQNQRSLRLTEQLNGMSSDLKRISESMNVNFITHIHICEPTYILISLFLGFYQSVLWRSPFGVWFRCTILAA
jgi:hypothetical protein